MKFRFNILFISLLIFSLGSYAQQDRPSIFGPVVGFTTEEEAREVIDRIVDVVGLKPNFEIKPADVPNASAVVYNGKRYILYNSVFLKQVRAAVRKRTGVESALLHMRLATI
jgi:hypothetical protein